MSMTRKKQRDLHEAVLGGDPGGLPGSFLFGSVTALSLPRSPGVPPFMHVPPQAAFASPLGSTERNLGQQKVI